ncbi:MAG: hypothetical protein QM784_27965 [Polyangiaceae bacterium]
MNAMPRHLILAAAAALALSHAPPLRAAPTDVEFPVRNAADSPEFRRITGADHKGRVIGFDARGLPAALEVQGLDPASSIDRLIQATTGSAGDKAIYSTFNSPGGTYVRSAACWAAGLDLTPISAQVVGTARTVTAISPRHVIFANHAAITNGATIHFVTAANETVSRTLSSQAQVGSTDIQIGTLNADLPAAIGIAKVLPANYEAWHALADWPVLIADQEKKALLAEVEGEGEAIVIRPPNDAKRLPLHEAMVSGDSGGPVCLVLGRQLVALTTMHFETSGPAIAANTSAINAAMTALGGGYQLSAIPGPLLWSRAGQDLGYNEPTGFGEADRLVTTSGSGGDVRVDIGGASAAILAPTSSLTNVGFLIKSKGAGATEVAGSNGVLKLSVDNGGIRFYNDDLMLGDIVARQLFDSGENTAVDWENHVLMGAWKIGANNILHAGSTLPLAGFPAGSALQYLRRNAANNGLELATVSGLGDVAGPASSVNGRIAVFSGTSGKALADSGSTLSDFQPFITAGTTAQYWRGDKSWQTLNAAAVGLGNVPNADATNAGNIAAGTLPAARLPALTGAITTTAGSAATSLGSITISQLNAAISDADLPTLGATLNTFTGDLLLGSNTALPTATPRFIDLGGTYGTNAEGDDGNLKVLLYNAGSVKHGLMVSAGLTGFKAGTGGGIGFFVNGSSTKVFGLSTTGAASFTSTVSAAGFTGPLTGNASSAAVLQTARTINGVSFDGSGNITIPATNITSGTLPDAQLAGGITRDTEWDTIAEIETAIGGGNILLATEMDTKSELNALVGDDDPAYVGTANAWGDGVKQTFNPNGTNAGINVGAQAGDPSTPANGDLWYDSTGNALRARINGATVSLGSGGGSGDVTAASSFGTDNRVIRSDGTGKGVQASGVALDDSNNLSGLNNLAAGGALTVTGATSTAAVTSPDQAHGNTGASEDFSAAFAQHSATLDQNTTFTTSAWPSSGTVMTMTLRLTQDGTGNRTVTWPGAVASPAAQINPAANSTTFVFLTSYNGGTTIYSSSDYSGDTTAKSVTLSETVAFASGWNGSDKVPTRNEVYDWAHLGDTDDDGLPNKLDIGAGLARTDSSGNLSAVSEYLEFALSDETTAITTGTGKLTWRAPFAMTITGVRASVATASSSGLPTVDINEGGTTIMSTNKLTIDASEKTSVTAATAAGVTDTAIADDAEITFDIDVAGTGATGLKVKIYFTR